MRVLPVFREFPGTKEALSFLRTRGFRLAVYSGFSRAEALACLSAVRLTEFFSVIVTVDEVSNPRPNPEGLFAAAAKLGCRAGECMYVGDTIADIQMARNAGVPIVCVKTGVQPNEALSVERPEYFVEDLREMLRILRLNDGPL